MKKLTIMILATLVILALAGCGGDYGTAGSAGSTAATATRVDTSTSGAAQDGADDAEQKKETAHEQKKETVQSQDNAPDSDVPLYPNAEEVYNDGGSVIYATSDSGEKVNSFYEGHPYLNEGKKARTLGKNTDYYEYRTPVVALAVATLDGLSKPDEKPQKEIDELNTYIDEFGGLSSLIILGSNMNMQAKEHFLFSPDLPSDKTLLVFGYQDKL